MRLLIAALILIAPAYCADFTTYLGGASINQSFMLVALATDSAGDTYVTGGNAFVTKLDPTGNIVFSVSLGSGTSSGNAIAVDPSGPRGSGPRGPFVDGSVALAANNYCNNCQVVLNYESINVTETVQYAGSAPGLIDGLMQINFTIPMQWNNDGAFVYLMAPGSKQGLMLGWVNIAQ